MRGLPPTYQDTFVFIVPKGRLEQVIALTFGGKLAQEGAGVHAGIGLLLEFRISAFQLVAADPARQK